MNILLEKRWCWFCIAIGKVTSSQGVSFFNGQCIKFEFLVTGHVLQSWSRLTFSLWTQPSYSSQWISFANPISLSCLRIWKATERREFYQLVAKSCIWSIHEPYQNKKTKNKIIHNHFLVETNFISFKVHVKFDWYLAKYRKLKISVNWGLVRSMQVLPPLCAELRNMVMQPMILPMVLTIAESQVLLLIFCLNYAFDMLICTTKRLVQCVRPHSMLVKSL